MREECNHDPNHVHAYGHCGDPAHAHAHGHGCNHDHAHAHGHCDDPAHAHPHDHDHSHSHGHGHDHGSPQEIFHISHHEGALIGSVHGRLPCGDFEQAQATLVELAHRIQDEICRQGGIVGHIKFIINSQEHCCQISLTGAEEHIRYFDMDSCSVEGVVIVFLVTEESLHRILQETVAVQLKKCSM